LAGPVLHKNGRSSLLVVKDRRFRAGGKKTSPGVKKEIMKQKILINHWRWLQVNGYKQQAASCKRQAASLTRNLYCVTVSYKRKDKRI